MTRAPLAWSLIALVSTAFSQDAEKPEPKSEEKPADWDVSAPPGPSHEVAIDVTKGTWLSLDVNPDGSDIIFDLLGDLYRIPIEGGEAEAITEGIAWDMQPAYSPDGSQIAFTSDRGGGDNIWIMDRDGKNSRQITKEDFRLYNSPAWSPDGRTIAARKHFTSKRSLGAGEIWLMHVWGGSGAQMVKRPNEQKDLGEPAFSPDGHYLYYSLDATPGGQFQYNKDPNEGIYAIRRLDRETGDNEVYISGPGGAIRPTPSPDGKYVAFIRRVRYDTTLFLHDTENGAEWPIVSGLDRDMQETWAIHGVYPAMEWMPDSGSIVYWSGGTFHRVDIESRAVTEIPFRVQSTRTVTDPLRFPVDVAPDTFTTKMLRWVQVAPDGTKVAFQALGHIYIRDLPDGEARRLTEDDARFEFWPSWSRDSQRIVYTTWNDETLGDVRMATLDGAPPRVVTTQPGHYVEPAMSPDGETIVFRKTSTDGLRARLWMRETGIYVVSSRGGEAKRITEHGELPHFGADNDRVYYLHVESGDPDDTRTLHSIALDGKDEFTHLTSKNAVEYRVSPDGEWVAFAERFRAYVTPLPLTGQAVDIGPKTGAFPVKKVSGDTGMYLHWSGDGEALHWALGPTLYTLALDAPRELFMAEDDAETIEPTVTDIGFDVPTAKPSGALAFVHARVITMNGDEVIDNATIVVEENRITAVGSSTDVSVPGGAQTIDCSGATIMPGIVDVHHHGPHGGDGITPQQNWSNYADLAFGVTTTHNPSADTETIFAAAEMTRAGRIVAPRMFSTGTILYGASGAIKAEVEGIEDAKLHLRRMKAVGAISVKSYNQPRRDQRQQVVAAARELEMMVVPEGGSLYQHNMTMVVDGHTGIEHSIPIETLYDDVLQLWGGNPEVHYTPTLVVAYGGWWGENYWYMESNVWEHERLTTFVPRRVIDPRSRRRLMIPEEELNHIDIAEGCKALTDAGVPVNLGAHGQLTGLGAHWELWMFAQGGMTNLEALHAATLNGAVYVGLDNDIGSIEVGKLADFVVLDANPLDDIRNSEDIRYTVLNGRMFDARTMNELGNQPHERAPFYFENDPSTKSMSSM